MTVLELHRNWHYLDECCDLINSEWPRSKVARSRSLQASCDDLPVSLVLVEKNKVLGHSKISRIPASPLSCFIESVVVHSSHRGKGFGKSLMLMCEDYVRKRGFDTVFLSTKDKVAFYIKLGYKVCEPIGIYGCSFTLNIAQPNSESSTSPNSHLSYNLLSSSEPQQVKHQISDQPPPLLAPPPPPFPSQVSKKSTEVVTSKLFETKVFMKKSI